MIVYFELGFHTGQPATFRDVEELEEFRWVNSKRKFTVDTIIFLPKVIPYQEPVKMQCCGKQSCIKQFDYIIFQKRVNSPYIYAHAFYGSVDQVNLPPGKRKDFSHILRMTEVLTLLHEISKTLEKRIGSLLLNMQIICLSLPKMR